MNENNVPKSHKILTVLWTVVPVSIFVSLLKIAGVGGVSVPLVSFFVTYLVIEKFRKNRVNQTRKQMYKEMRLSFLVIVLCLFILPMAILFLTTDI